MTADRVSVGSPGGAGGNEIEAVKRVLLDADLWIRMRMDEAPLPPDAAHDIALDAIAALDAVRRSPQGEDHERGLRAMARVMAWVPQDVADDLVAQGIARLDRNSGVIYLGDARLIHSPQGEDHETGSQDALARGTLAQWQATGDGCYLDNADADTLRVMVRLLSRASSPVSGTEPDTAKLRAKLDEMALVDDTRDPHDEGYMGAVVELREWLDGFSVDAGKAREER